MSNASQIAPGVPFALTWSVANVASAASCSLSGAWSGPMSALSGSSNVGPLSANTSYGIACTGPGGTSNVSLTVAIAATGHEPVMPTSFTVDLLKHESRDVNTFDALVAAGAKAPNGCFYNRYQDHIPPAQPVVPPGPPVITSASHADLVLNGDSAVSPFRLFETLGSGQTVFAGTNFSGSAVGVDWGMADNYGFIPSLLAQLHVTVEPQADTPVANDDIRTTVRGVPLVVTVTDNDQNLDRPVTLQIEVAPANGTVVLMPLETSGIQFPLTPLPDPYFFYTPAPNFVGTDQFKYRIVGNQGKSAVATVTVNVTSNGCQADGQYGAPLSGRPNSDWYVAQFPNEGGTGAPVDYAGRGAGFAAIGNASLVFGIRDFDTMHEGIDVLAMQCGQIVAINDRAQPDNFVIPLPPPLFSLTTPPDTCGNSITIQQANGRRDQYCHLRYESAEHLYRLPMLSTGATGDWIAKGQKIGSAGRAWLNVSPALSVASTDNLGNPLDIFKAGIAGFSDPTPQTPLMIGFGVTKASDFAASTFPDVRRYKEQVTFAASDQFVPWIDALAIPPNYLESVSIVDARGAVINNCEADHGVSAVWYPRLALSQNCGSLPIGSYTGKFSIQNTSTSPATTVQSTSWPFTVVASLPSGAPTLSLTSSASTTTPGQPITLSWLGQNVQTCQASGSWHGNFPPSGSSVVNTSSTSATNSYEMTCDGVNGRIRASTLVTVYGSPVTNIVADRTTIVSGASVIVTYTYSNSSSCQLDGSPLSGTTTGVPGTPVSGSVTLTGVTASTNVTLTCSGPDGMTSSIVPVTVLTGTHQPPVAVDDTLTLNVDSGSARIPFSSLIANDSASGGSLAGQQYIQWTQASDWSQVFGVGTSEQSPGQWGIDLTTSSNSAITLHLQYTVQDNYGAKSNTATATVTLLPQGKMLTGAPAALATSASVSYAAGGGVTGDEVSVDGNGAQVARTEFVLQMSPTATVSDVNSILVSVQGSIIGMSPQSTVYTVQIPDAGTLANLDAILDRVGANAAVVGAFYSTVASTEEWPANLLNVAELPLHNAAIGGATAWNARSAVADHDQTVSGPILILVDGFGEGTPDPDAFNVQIPWGDVTGDQNNRIPMLPDNTGDAQGCTTGLAAYCHSVQHGYHVLGLATSSFDDAQTHFVAPGIFPGWATGKWANTSLLVRVVDMWQFSLSQKRITWRTTPELMERVRKIINDESLSASGLHTKNNFVVSISLGTSKISTRYWGSGWAQALKELKTYTGAQVLLSVAAGNDSGQMGVAVNELAKWAALVPNSFIVENREFDVLPQANPVFHYASCLDPSSNFGTISAIGSQAAPSGGSVPLGITSYVDALGARGQKRGTSMATPQVAGLAVYLWSIQPNFSAAKIQGVISSTAHSAAASPYSNIVSGMLTLPCLENSDGSLAAGSSFIDPYAATLALDDPSFATGAASTPAMAATLAPVRFAILDINGDGKFDVADVVQYLQAFVANWRGNQVAEDFSRADLNGNHFTSGPNDKYFGVSSVPATMDLDGDGKITKSASVSIAPGVTVTFDETSITDTDALCYYVLSPLFSGDRQQVNIQIDVFNFLSGQNIPHCMPDIIGATIKLNGTLSGYTGFPATVNISNLEAAVPELSYFGSNLDNGCGGENGGPIFSTVVHAVDSNTPTYAADSVSGVPWNFISGVKPGCSSFIAVRNLGVKDSSGVDQTQIWINASQGQEGPSPYGPGTLTREFQIRLYSGDPGNQAATSYATYGYVDQILGPNFVPVFTFTPGSFSFSLQLSSPQSH
jgi:hypothetical protein